MAATRTSSRLATPLGDPRGIPKQFYIQTNRTIILGCLEVSSRARIHRIIKIEDDGKRRVINMKEVSNDLPFPELSEDDIMAALCDTDLEHFLFGNVLHSSEDEPFSVSHIGDAVQQCWGFKPSQAPKAINNKGLAVPFQEHSEPLQEHNHFYFIDPLFPVPPSIEETGPCLSFETSLPPLAAFTPYSSIFNSKSETTFLQHPPSPQTTESIETFPQCSVETLPQCSVEPVPQCSVEPVPQCLVESVLPCYGELAQKCPSEPVQKCRKRPSSVTVRQQNNAACKRYRERERRRQADTDQTLQELRRINAALHQVLAEKKAEISRIQNLLIQNVILNRRPLID